MKYCIYHLSLIFDKVCDKNGPPNGLLKIFEYLHEQIQDNVPTKDDLIKNCFLNSTN